MDTRQPINSVESSPTGSQPDEKVYSSSPTSDRRNSIEWDASKVPPSRFQKRKGSIYAVPSSRDGHIDSNYASKFHEKHREMWKEAKDAITGNTSKRRGSTASSSGGGVTSGGRRQSDTGLDGEKGRRESSAV